MTNLYYIENRGCDDTTKGLAIIPDKFWDIFEATIENLNKNSSYGCMPRIAVYKIDETMIKKLTENDEATKTTRKRKRRGNIRKTEKEPCRLKGDSMTRALLFINLCRTAYLA